MNKTFSSYWDFDASCELVAMAVNGVFGKKIDNNNHIVVDRIKDLKANKNRIAINTDYLSDVDTIEFNIVPKEDGSTRLEFSVKKYIKLFVAVMVSLFAFFLILVLLVGLSGRKNLAVGLGGILLFSAIIIIAASFYRFSDKAFESRMRIFVHEKIFEFVSIAKEEKQRLNIYN